MRTGALRLLFVASVLFTTSLVFGQGTVSYFVNDGEKAVFHRPFLSRSSAIRAKIIGANRRLFIYTLATKNSGDSNDKYVVASTSVAIPALVEIQDAPPVADAVKSYAPAYIEFESVFNKLATAYADAKQTDFEFAWEVVAVLNDPKSKPAAIRDPRNEAEKVLAAGINKAWTDAVGQLNKVRDSLVAYGLIVLQPDGSYKVADAKMADVVLRSPALTQDSDVIVRFTGVGGNGDPQPLSSLAAEIARPAATHATLGTGLFMTLGSNAYTYSAQPTALSTTIDYNGVKAGTMSATGKTNYLIQRTQIGSNLNDDISGVFYYIFDEEAGSLRHWFGGPGRTGLMIGLNASNNDGALTPSYLVGASYFLDRDLTAVLSFGVAFRQGQALVGAVNAIKTMGNVYADNELFTQSRWLATPFIGLSFNIK
jgi:hypothetical protein